MNAGSSANGAPPARTPSSTPRNTRPVFVVGSARSGTTLLYHMLLSGGGFAVFRAETHAYDVLGPRYRYLRAPELRNRFINDWLKTRQFELSGLDAREFTADMARCKSIGDFLEIFLGGIARQQGAIRWSDCTPAHVSHIATIKREIPDALIIHVIRDGRDVALSAARLGWDRPLPGDRISPRLLAALGWQWSVRAGRAAGRLLGEDYLEVRFEDVVQKPSDVLDAISAFLDHPLDYEKIRDVAIGSVSKPNTSFRSKDETFAPIGRFRTGFKEGELADVEGLIGDLLEDLKYDRAAPSRIGALPLQIRRAVYDGYLTAKLWARVHTPLGRRTSLESLDIW